MQNDIDLFFNEYFSGDLKAVYVDKFPKEMIASAVDQDGWFKWKPIKGSLSENDYQNVETKFHVTFPKSFILWHKAYYFENCDLSILKLPGSLPNAPLKEIIDHLNYDIAKDLIKLRLIPFAMDGFDEGTLVFDGRQSEMDNEFPIRTYNFDYNGQIDGLGDVIFSSFGKMLQCLTHFLQDRKSRRDFDIFPDFLRIDPNGAGKTGVDYWLNYAAMERSNFEEFGE